MKIGELRDRITISRKIRTSDGAGGFTFTWSQVGSIWCAVTTLTGKALFMHDGKREKESVLIRFRDGANIQIGDRINWRGSNIDIGNVTPVAGIPKWLEAQGEIVQAGEA